MKNSFVTFYLLFATIVAFAQPNNKDEITLKKGKVIRGRIIEQVPNQLLKILTEEGNTIVLSMDHVEKITERETMVLQEIPQRPAPSLIIAQPIENPVRPKIETTLKPKKENTVQPRKENTLQATNDKVSQPINDNTLQPEQDFPFEERNSEYIGGRKMFFSLGLSFISLYDYSDYYGGNLQFGFFVHPKNLLSIEYSGGTDEIENNCHLFLFSWSYFVHLSEHVQWRIGPSVGLLNTDDTENVFAYAGNTGFVWNFTKSKRWFFDLGYRLLKSDEIVNQINMSVGFRF